MAEKGLNKNEVIAQLARSEHGDLKAYVPMTRKVAKEDPEFLAHLIAWNEINGQIRDSKIALPVGSFSVPTFKNEFGDNSYAHIAKLSPIELEKAWRLAKEVGINCQRDLRKLVTIYLRMREANPNWFMATALQHKASLKALYSLCHVEVKKNSLAKNILFESKYPKGSAFEAVKNLKHMTTREAAAAIIKHKIPFVVASPGVGKRLREEELLLALVENMSATELVTNTNMLIRCGMNKIPSVRAAYDEGLTKKVAESKKNVLKTTRAVETLKASGGDKKTVAKLQTVQEKQLKSFGVDGDWLILGDKSGSMAISIEVARQVAAILAKVVTGRVHLVFFDVVPRHMDVTGLTYDEIKEKTKNVTADGGTSIGCGLQFLLDKNIEIDGIAVVSDGGENTSPYFYEVFKRYTKKFDKDVPIYFYNVYGSNQPFSQFLRSEKIDFQEFNISGTKLDFYSLPNLVQTMNVNRYRLIDVVMNTPLLSIKDVFNEFSKNWYE